MLKNNAFLNILLLCLSLNIFLPADNDAPFGDILLHHVTNDQSEVYIDLDFGFIDMSVTKHVILIWVIAGSLILLTLAATSRYRKNKNALPSRLSSLFEILIDFIQNEMVIPNIGKKYTRTWTPLVATFFIFILFANFLGLIPFLEKLPGGSSTITGNFAVTAGLAFITFISIIVAGSVKHGFIGHWKNMIPGGLPAPVLLILIPVEIMGMFIKPLALLLRLGANMTAGHIGMVAIFGLPILIGNSMGTEIGFGVGFVSVILNTAIYFLEMIVCLVQAYVFALLSSVFIGMAIHAEH